METVLTAIYVAFAIAMTYLVGFTVYEQTKRLSWMKNQDLLGLVCGIFSFIFFIKYGWPVYQVLVIQVFA